MFLGEGCEPKREFGKVYGFGVAVYAIQAPLGDQSSGEDGLGLVCGYVRCGVVALPSFDEGVGELAAGLDQEKRLIPLPGRRS